MTRTFLSKETLCILTQPFIESLSNILDLSRKLPGSRTNLELCKMKTTIQNFNLHTHVLLGIVGSECHAHCTGSTFCLRAQL